MRGAELAAGTAVGRARRQGGGGTFGAVWGVAPNIAPKLHGYDTRDPYTFEMGTDSESEAA